MTPEWSYMQRVGDIESPVKTALTANDKERTALAKRFGIVSIQNLKADLLTTPEFEAGRYRVTGTFKASVTQICVRSAVPFSSVIEDEVEGFFADKAGTISFAKARKKREEEQGDNPNFIDEAEDPEPLDDGCIDLGELVAQHLSLALNPYPISPDAPDLPEDMTGEKVQIDNPFAILGQLREFMEE